MADIIRAPADSLRPIIALIAMGMLRPLLRSIGDSGNVRVKAGAYALTLGDATANIASSLSDIQARLAKLSERLDAGSPPSSPVPPASSASTKKTAAAITEDRKPRRMDRRLLWVDDHPANNAFLIERLRATGYVVDTSTTTQAALARLASTDYALLITDLGRVEDGENRPMAGRDLIRAVRARDPHLPCLVFSSARAVHLSEQLLADGASGVTSSGTELIRFVDTHGARR